MLLIRYIEVDFTFVLPNHVCYNEEFVTSRFVNTRFCSIRFTMILARLKNKYTLKKGSLN